MASNKKNNSVRSTSGPNCFSESLLCMKAMKQMCALRLGRESEGSVDHKPRSMVVQWR
ncbi:Protein of unknown function [Pyronema omphalodes CBS 100304]|uniref:Uncharacterized protein n=1 Tax=Pyronema omphalodes (strain CBS 100304) TaxID=1076935 RepID=U4KV36_PYROM|nr:Protein of unknown function [Pyronema omphalodes CBS 100304]